MDSENSNENSNNSQAAETEKAVREKPAAQAGQSGGGKKAGRKKEKKFIFDYKDPVTLYSFLEGGRIMPARNSGLTSAQQKELRKAIKKSRTIGLIPSSLGAYDSFGRPAQISPKPFSCKD